MLSSSNFFPPRIPGSSVRDCQISGNACIFFFKFIIFFLLLIYSLMYMWRTLDTICNPVHVLALKLSRSHFLISTDLDSFPLVQLVCQKHRRRIWNQIGVTGNTSQLKGNSRDSSVLWFLLFCKSSLEEGGVFLLSVWLPDFPWPQILKPYHSTEVYLCNLRLCDFWGRS